MGKVRIPVRLAALVAVLSLVLAASAVAYTVPGPPGSPGGPPTKPKSGTKSTKKGATTVANVVAGFTGSELAKKGHFTVKVSFPSGGAISAKITSGGETLATGNASSKTKASNKDLTITFTKKGKTFLDSVNGQGIKLTIHFTFNPNKGKTKTSTSTVRLDA